MSEGASTPEVVAETITPQSEKLLKTDADFLGTKGLGFSSRKYGELSASLDNLKLEERQYNEATYIERQQLHEEFGGGFDSLGKRNPLAEPRFLTRRGPRAGGMTPELVEKEKRAKRLRDLQWGDSKRRGFGWEIRRLEEGVILEESKRSDMEDLAIATSKIHEGVKSIKNREISSKLSPADSFLEIGARDPVASEVERGKKVTNEVWFHTTGHLNQTIDNGGLATQAWIEKHDPDYFEILVTNSIARGLEKQGKGRIDSNLSSPLNQVDRDRIYFQENSISEFYGSAVIAYAPEDILADTNLYFVPPNAKGFWSHERVVSDISDLESDSIPPNGDSDLCLPLEKAYIAVPKEEYIKTCEKLLENGYDAAWIRQRVISYRGYGEEHFKGQKLAAQEIKRRINQSRQIKQKQNYAAIGNPKAKLIDYPNVCQLVTIAS